jgi:hypothetical protein
MCSAIRSLEDVQLIALLAFQVLHVFYDLTSVEQVCAHQERCLAASRIARQMVSAVTISSSRLIFPFPGCEGARSTSARGSNARVTGGVHPAAAGASATSCGCQGRQQQRPEARGGRAAAVLAADGARLIRLRMPGHGLHAKSAAVRQRWLHLMWMSVPQSWRGRSLHTMLFVFSKQEYINHCSRQPAAGGPRAFMRGRWPLQHGA